MGKHKHSTGAKSEGCCSPQGTTAHDHSEHSDHNHSHDHIEGSVFQLLQLPLVTFALMLSGIVMDHWGDFSFFDGWVRLSWYGIAYLIVGVPVLKEAVESIQKGDVFSEFFLMAIATLGAFAIGEYPEGVAVMLFYSVGEVFQTLAVSRAKGNIKALLDQRPDEVTAVRGNSTVVVPAESVSIGEVIQLKAGEKVALDGDLLSDNGTFNTAALTGESVPQDKTEGDRVLAGMINLNTPTQLRVSAIFEDTKLSKILSMVENASSQKAPTELFIRKFARIYTPIVVLLAAMIWLLPLFFVQDYQWQAWLYRALVFLVISCPCALVISIPLGYFGGVGAASRNGILFKGSSFLDTLANIDNVVTDKTGTLTEGVFDVQEIVFDPAFDQQRMLHWVEALERNSTHPVASAIQRFVGNTTVDTCVSGVEEIAGHGLKGIVEGKLLLAGNTKLMRRFGVPYDSSIDQLTSTVIAVAYDSVFVGYIGIADTVKADAKSAVGELQELSVAVTMLSGDKGAVVQQVADQLGITRYYGDLLPEDKVLKIKEIKSSGESVAFVGDGVNDAPVVALSDVGIAMGGLGSDATIETADVVIQDDKPSKIPVAIRIGKKTKQIVWQNITLAFTVKAAVLLLGAGGLATMWEAVFADVGVSLLAILNAVRIQRMDFKTPLTKKSS